MFGFCSSSGDHVLEIFWLFLGGYWTNLIAENAAIWSQKKASFTLFLFRIRFFIFNLPCRRKKLITLHRILSNFFGTSFVLPAKANQIMNKVIRKPRILLIIINLVLIIRVFKQPILKPFDKTLITCTQLWGLRITKGILFMFLLCCLYYLVYNHCFYLFHFLFKS